jgi:hypothetical protein
VLTVTDKNIKILKDPIYSIFIKHNSSGNKLKWVRFVLRKHSPVSERKWQQMEKLSINDFLQEKCQFSQYKFINLMKYQ